MGSKYPIKEINMNIDLTSRLLERNKGRAGEAGRYSCSKIWSFLNGYCSPENYLAGEKIDFQSAFRMFNGSIRHEAIQSLLPEYEHEVKKEMEIEGFTLVGMVDCINSEEILEIKTSDKLYDKAKPWAIYQAKLYCTMFDRPLARVVQPIVNGGLLLKELSVVKRDDKWFSGEMSKLKKFDIDVKKLSLEECLNSCDNYDEACEKCNTQINKSNMTARDVWDEHIAK